MWINMDYEELAGEFIHVMASFAKTKTQNKVAGFSQGENYMLYFLNRHRRHVLPREISSEMRITTARTAAVLNNLENKGLINRAIDRHDRRQILVELTKDGEKAAEERQKEYIEITKKILESLGEEDAKELVRIMKKLMELQVEKKE